MSNVDIRAYYELRYSILTADHGQYAVHGKLIDTKFYRSSHDFLLSLYGLKHRLLDISKQSKHQTAVLDRLADFVTTYLNPFLCRWHPKFFTSTGKPVYRKIDEYEADWWDGDVRQIVAKAKDLTNVIEEEIK